MDGSADPWMEEKESMLLDLRRPASWYPLARQMRRTIIAHLGPTNSGGAIAQMDALLDAPSLSLVVQSEPAYLLWLHFAC